MKSSSLHVFNSRIVVEHKSSKVKDSIVYKSSFSRHSSKTHVQNTLARPRGLPELHLLSFHVLQAALVEADFDNTLQYLPPEGRQVAQLLQLNLVTLALVQVGERFFVVLGRDRGGGRQDVLESGRECEGKS